MLKENQLQTVPFSRLTQNIERQYEKEIIFSQKLSHIPAPFNSQEKYYPQRLWKKLDMDLPSHPLSSPPQFDQGATSFSSWMNHFYFFFFIVYWSSIPFAPWFQALPLHYWFLSCVFPAGWGGITLNLRGGELIKVMGIGTATALNQVLFLFNNPGLFSPLVLPILHCAVGMQLSLNANPDPNKALCPFLPFPSFLSSCSSIISRLL